MKRFFLSFAVTAGLFLLLTCCEKNNEAVFEPKVLTAYVDDNIDTKTALNGLNVIWSSSDVISAFDYDFNNNPSTKVVVNESGSKAQFTIGSLSLVDNVYYALYPYQEDASLTDAGVICASVPTTQTATENGFAPNANLAVADGGVSDLQFYNVCGLLGFTVNNSEIKKITLSVASTSGIAGNCYLYLSSSGLTSWVDFYNGHAPSSSVSLEGTFVAGGTYYMAVLPGEYSDVKLRVETDTKYVEFSNSNKLTVARNSILEVASLPDLSSYWKDKDNAGGTVTFVAGDDVSSNTSISKNGITLTATSFSNASYYQTFKSSTMKVASTVGNITKIEFTCTASGDAKYGPGCYELSSSSTGSYSYSGTVGTWEGDAAEVAFTASTNQVRMSQVVVTYGSGSGSDSGSSDNEVTAPTFSLAEGTFTAAQTLELTTDVEGGSIYYTIDGSDPTSSTTKTEYTSAISIKKTITIKAVVKDADGNYSDVVSKTYTISIVNTQETAYSVTKTIELIDDTPETQLGVEKVYVKGTISKIDSYSDTYGSITYWLDDNSFEVYGGLNDNGEKFTSIDDIKVGAQVVVYGLVKKYGTSPVIYEFDKNSWLVSYTAPAVSKTTATISPSYSNSLTVGGEDDTYDVSYNGDGTLSVKSSDTSVATASLSGNNVTIHPVAVGTTTITISAPETAAYTAASKSYTLTVNPAVEAASLPFSFDGGKADIENTTGMSHSGLDSDYSASPKLKFNDANDEVVVNFNSVAKRVSFVAKGNGVNSTAWAGIFKVQESSDGSNYTEVQSYSNLTAEATRYSCLLSSSSRYVKFIYSTKTTGNVALGDIKIISATEVEDPELSFENSTYTFKDTDVKVVKATSAIGSNGVISYSLEEGDSDAFTIDANTGAITCTTAGTYKVKATIAAVSGFSTGTATCTVKIDSASSVEKTFTFSDVASSNSWTNGTAYTSFTIDGFTFTVSGGGNNGKYYTSDSTWRFYSGGSLTISYNGKKVTSVTTNPTTEPAISEGVATIAFSGTVKIKSITVKAE